MVLVRARHTRQSDPALAGPTTQTAVRVPEVQRQAVQDAIAGGLPGIHSFTDVVVDALWLWLYEQQQEWRQVYGKVTISGQMLKDGPVQEHTFVPPEMDLSDPGLTLSEDAVVVLDETGGHVVDRPRPDSAGRPRWEDVDPDLLEDS